MPDALTLWSLAVLVIGGLMYVAMSMSTGSANPRTPARATARFAIAGQIEAARQKDRRDEMARRVTGFRDRINRRLGLYKCVAVHATTGEQLEAISILWSMHGEEDLFSDLAFMSLTDHALQQAVKTFMKVDARSLQISRSLVIETGDQWTAPDKRQELTTALEEQVVGRLNDAIQEVHRVADVGH